MILSKTIEIKISFRNKKKYEEILNQFLNIDDIIHIKPQQLSKNSQYKILVSCDICGIEKETTYQLYKLNYDKRNIYTCKKCSKFKSELTCLEKYGTTNYAKTDESKEKQKETFLNKYGVDNPMKDNKILKKVISTNIKKYGCKYTLQSDKIKEKSKKTLINKYGVDNISKSQYWKNKVKETSIKNWNVNSYSKTIESKQKTIETNLKKYGCEYHSQRKDVKNNIIEYTKEYNQKRKNDMFKIYEIKEMKNNDVIYYCETCKKNIHIELSLYKNRFKTKTTLCTNCNPIDQHQSGLEIQLDNFIKNNYDGTIILNSKKVIHPYELDIYLPDLNLAFEFNGLYWHSEINRNKDYHKMKSDLCEEKGIQLIHIWEDDWKYRQDIIKSIILKKLNVIKKIRIKNPIIKEINPIKSEIFLNENYIYGNNENLINIGLFNDDELISVLSFNSNKIVSFCEKNYLTIEDSFEKLFNWYLNKYNYKNIYLILNRSYYNEFDFIKSNFKIIEYTKPNLYYLNNDLKTNISYPKENKNIKIYDAGNIKLIYN